MDKLWTKRTPPTPLSWETLSDLGRPYLVFNFEEMVKILFFLFPSVYLENLCGNQEGLIKDQQVWSPSECARAMSESVKTLHRRFKVFVQS